MNSLPINKIICGDCLEVMPTFPDESIDLVVTSPPYDNLRNYHGYTFDFEGVANQLFRVIKGGGIVVWIVADATIDGSETGTSFNQAIYFKKIGFNLHDTMIYYKLNPVPLTHNRYEQTFEYMFVFSKNRPKTVNLIKERTYHYGLKRTRSAGKEECTVRKREETTIINEYKYRNNVWQYIVGWGNKNMTQHVAPFPLKLAEDHIYSWSNENDVVLDPFIGSGTTAIAAINLKRKYIGIDISQEYCELATEKIREHTKQITIFD